ncbi:bifunctional diguanylate cyclase/phosphodiesterase [Roseateles amylovorans]|uniref:EAL and GGDEF domain-containing protein n=1 Tax=Roseateles amylovorans TaxID=2978473 RepID=A0ABY6B7X3_9BURK|nr:bifunctional diguanylate cyclase/phosphodiesterase [Roseateles amylovorans]UXH79655.1 EAL and GGDEF domain-containing protein [Roseateles amylovorans]
MSIYLSSPDPFSVVLSAIIRDQLLDIHFQPLVELERAHILGFEALTRGPADSPLHSPLVLFETAARLGRLVELERIVVRRALRRFKELQLPGQLFLNLTADTLLATGEHGALIAREFAQLDLPASRVVIELTETRPILEPERLQASMRSLRELGFVVALDDLGEGFASLKRWMDIRPDFVKIDRHFIDGIAQEPLKQQFVRSILEMAARSGCTVVAEGLEHLSDLTVLRRLGVTVCQGYLLARPSAAPRTTLRAEVDALLAPEHRRRHADWRRLPPDAITNAAQLARRSHTVTPKLSCQTVVDMFQRDERLFSMPVLDPHNRPIGLLRSLQVLKRSAERYFMDIHEKRSCTALMDPHPLIFDASTSLRDMSEAIASLDDRLMVDGFIVTRDGEYFGTGRSTDLLKAVSDLQVHSARYANPLTLLPGNVPTDQHLDALLHEGREFVVVAWDIDHFKPFNDVYGYAAGDDIIKLCAQLLQTAADPQLDFVGHIGGDDFVMVLGSADWTERLTQVCQAFDHQLRPFFSADHLALGGYITLNRQNQESFNPLPTLSAGVIPVLPGAFDSVRALSAALAEPKHVAKCGSGPSRFFVDRRRSSPPAEVEAVMPLDTSDSTMAMPSLLESVG